MSTTLKPAFVLGSGFHRHVLGDGHHVTSRPLYDWHYLLTQVAHSLQVAVPSEVLTPIQRWDTIILRAVTEGYKDHKGQWINRLNEQANVAEIEARRAVANIINGASNDYPQSTRAQIPLMDCWGSVISLNFDVAWLPKAFVTNRLESKIKWQGSSKLIQREYRRLTISHLSNGVDSGLYRRVWFPNGSYFAPETIRMGLNDYGSAAHSIQVTV